MVGVFAVEKPSVLLIGIDVDVAADVPPASKSATRFTRLRLRPMGKMPNERGQGF